MIAREALRYLAAGGANTAVTYALYLALLQWLDYRLAYALAFACGVGLSFLLLRHAVFARPGSAVRCCGPPSVKVCNWALGSPWCKHGLPGCGAPHGWPPWSPRWCACP